MEGINEWKEGIHGWREARKEANEWKRANEWME